MTVNITQRSASMPRPGHRRSRDWLPITPTPKRAGEWEQVPGGFRRIGA